MERSNNIKDIRLVLITVDKNSKLRIDANRYIFFHIVDCTFVANPRKYKDLVKITEKNMEIKGFFKANFKIKIVMGLNIFYIL